MATLSSDLHKRLEKIRVGFLFDHPFLSVLALSLPMHYQKNPHEIFETDGLSIYVDQTRVNKMTDGALKYQYAHTLLHILLKHAFRIRDRDKKVWNRSSDVVINLLMDDFERIGERPENEVLIEKFRDQSVEEVYNTLYQENPEGEGTPDDANPKEQKLDLIENKGDAEAAQETIDTLIVQAMGLAKKQGNIPASFLEVISQVIRPKIDLETLLHAYMTESFFDKVSDFSRPNRRFIHQNLYLPGYRQEKNRLILYIALDRSMSISPEVFSRFLGIVDAVLRISSDFMVTVVPFDERVDEEKIITYTAQELRPPIFFEKGNGGTDFGAILSYLKEVGEFDASLMVLSDGFFKIDHPARLNTLFLLSEKKNLKRFEAYGDVFYFDL